MPPLLPPLMLVVRQPEWIPERSITLILPRKGLMPIEWDPVMKEEVAVFFFFTIIVINDFSTFWIFDFGVCFVFL